MSSISVREERLRVVAFVSERVPTGERLLEQAARLAARLRAEMIAAFWRNPALRWSASLPFTRSITRFGLIDGDFDPATVERALRLVAAEIERLATELARRFQISCAFVELGLDLALLQPGDVLIVDLAELRALQPALGTLQLPAGTVLAIAGRRPGPVVALSAGNATTLALCQRWAEETGVSVFLHLVDGPAAAKVRMLGQLARLQATPAVRIRRTLDLTAAVQAAASDIIQHGAGSLILDGELTAEALGPLLDTLAERHAGFDERAHAGPTGQGLPAKTGEPNR